MKFTKNAHPLNCMGIMIKFMTLASVLCVTSSYAVERSVEVLSDKSTKYAVVSESTSGDLTDVTLRLSRNNSISYQRNFYDCGNFNVKHIGEAASEQELTATNDEKFRPIIPESVDYFIANDVCRP